MPTDKLAPAAPSGSNRLEPVGDSQQRHSGESPSLAEAMFRVLPTESQAY